MNKLINGDSTNELEILVKSGIKVDSIVIDPPYGVDFKSHYDDSKEYVFRNVDSWFENLFKLLKDKKHMFVFVPTKEIHKWIQAGINAGFNYKNMIATKTHFIGGTFKPKNNFSYEFQPVLHFTKGIGENFKKYDFIKTSPSWFKDKRNLNPKEFTYIYTNFIDKELSFSNTKSTKKNNKDTERHPNEKNVDFIKFLIGISTNENDIVLDCFMGSGTTGVAAKNLYRNFIGIELDQKFYNIAKNRIEVINETT